MTCVNYKCPWLYLGTPLKTKYLMIVALHLASQFALLNYLSVLRTT